MGKPNWFIVVDEKTKMKFSRFFATKNGIVEPTCMLIDKFEKINAITKYIRCDNAGENKTLEKTINGAKWKKGIQFKYTARSTPQQNSLAETAFSYLLNQAKALMIEANIPYLIRYKIIQEAAVMVTKLDGLIIDPGETKTRYERFGLKLPKFVNHMRTWGEAGVVKTSSKTSAKLKDKGITCAFTGYADDHAGDCYRMWDPVEHQIYITRDVI